MSEYVLQKKTKCEICHGAGYLIHARYMPDGSFPLAATADNLSQQSPCHCKNGYIYEEVSLAEALDAYWKSEDEPTAVVGQVIGDAVPAATRTRFLEDAGAKPHGTDRRERKGLFREEKLFHVRRRLRPVSGKSDRCITKTIDETITFVR